MTHCEMQIKIVGILQMYYNQMYDHAEYLGYNYIYQMGK